TAIEWSTADDHRSCFRCYGSVACGLAQPALVCAAHGAVDTADLQMAGDPGQRRSDHDPPARGPRAHRAGIVARPRTHEPDAGSTPRNLVGDLHPGHALVRRRLERRDQWRLPSEHHAFTGAAIGDLAAGDHRRAAVAVLEADRAGARRDAGELA